MHDDASTDHPSSFLPDPKDGAAPASTESPRSQLPLGDHGTAARICPFLRTAAEGDALGPPVESPDPANRCVALHEPVPQSLRQQDLVCLSTAHVNCPRYLRGSVGVPAPVAAVEPVAATRTVTPTTASRTVTPATAAALALFGLAFVVSVGFVVATGGLTLTAAAPTATQGGAVLGEVDAPSDQVSTPEPTPLPTPTAAATASPSPTPEPTPEPSPTPATPEPTAKPKPTSDRFALLKPCPKTADCYIYVVRSGDNLFSIAKYFGVPLKTVQAMNPWTQSGLVAGRELRIPTPTR